MKIEWIELKRDFKQKAGYTLYKMRKTPYSNPKCAVEIKMYYCYPDNNPYNDKYIAYLQASYETTAEDANKTFLRLQRQGFTAKRKRIG